MSATKTDVRQLISRSTLTRITGAADSQLNSVVEALEKEITPPLALSVSDLVISVGAITIVNPSTSLNKTITPISSLIPTFTGETITLGASGSDSATPSSGTAVGLEMEASQYLRLGINIDKTGDVVLTKGVTGSSLSAATIPPTGGVFAIGHVVVKTDASNAVQNIQTSDIYQYIGGSGSSSGSGVVKANLFESTLTSKPTDITSTIDGKTLTTGNSVLFSNLASNNNRIYEVTVEPLNWVSAGTVSNSTHNITDIFFLDSNKGWMVGESGTIQYTTDGGATWTSAGTSFTSATINRVVFTSEFVGHAAAGTGGYVGYTFDGGQTWTGATDSTTANADIFFVDADYGWYCRTDDKMYSTSNGGTTWSSAFSTPTGSACKRIYAISSTVGWLITSDGVLYKSSDGFSSATAQTTSSQGVLNKVFFFDTNNGWAVGDSGLILATTDGGTTWTAQTSGTTENLNAVYFLDADKGWAVGTNGATLTTIDGGTTWIVSTTTVTDDLIYVKFSDAITGLTAGFSGTSGSVLTSTIPLTWEVTTPFKDASETPEIGDEVLILNGSSYAGQKIYFDENSKFGLEESTSGSGEKNYLSASASSLGSWLVSGNMTLGNVTTAADLPRPNTTKKGLKFTSSGAGYGYVRFTLDPADYTRKLKVKLDQKPGAEDTDAGLTAYASGDMSVDVYAYTTSDHSDTPTRLALSTDSDSVSALPNLTGTYQTSFDAPGSSAPYLELRITRVANSSSLVLSDIVVGPGTIGQVPAVGANVDFTWTSNDSLTWSAQAGNYQQKGEVADLNLYGEVSAGSAGSSSDWTITLPTDLKVVAGNYSGVALTSYHSESALATSMSAYVIADGTNVIKVGAVNWRATLAIVDFAYATADKINAISIHASLPIAEWAGSGRVNMGQNEPMYAWNSSTSTTSDTTSFGYGETGVSIQAFAPTGINSVNKRVRFLHPVQIGTSPYLEVWDTNGWTRFADRLGTFGQNSGGTTAWGYRVNPVSGSSTDYDVSFFATYDQVSTDTWSSLSSFKWRLTAASPSQATGFAEVVPGKSSGLVSANGLKGSTDGTAALAGYVGEEIKDSAAMTVTSTVSNFMHLDLTPGVWAISALAVVNGTTSAVWVSLGISSASASTSGLSEGDDLAYGTVSSAGVGSVSIPRIIVNITSDTTYYAVGQTNTSTVNGHVSMLATRIR